MKTLETMEFNKEDFLPTNPDDAESIIGGCVMSELHGDGFFRDINYDDYDFMWYLSHKVFTETGEILDQWDQDNYHPVQIVATYKEGKSDQRVFYLNYQQYCNALDDDTGADPDDWKEINLIWHGNFKDKKIHIW